MSLLKLSMPKSNSKVQKLKINETTKNENPGFNELNVVNISADQDVVN